MAAPRPKSPELSPVSREWLDRTDPAERKRRGQYLTPRPIAEALLDRCGLEPGMKVLDPGVGTGELLRAALDREPRIEATGWDTDPAALEAASRLVPEACLCHRSALEGDSPTSGFDLVIGNPPYFQIRLDREERSRFSGVISGRANIFALFFQAGLDRLKDGGRLAFIVPPSMNSGAYFEALREHITGRSSIVDLTILPGSDRFEGANTAAQLLVLKKRNVAPVNGPGDRFVFRREVAEARFRRLIFTPHPKRLAGEFTDRVTVWDLGGEAATGRVVWNEHRDALKNRPGPGRVPLVWSRDLRNAELIPGAEGRDGGEGPSGNNGNPRPGYFQLGDGRPAPVTGPAVLVNRVVGAVGRGELRSALLPEGAPFLAENHVNVILPAVSAAKGNVAASGRFEWQRIWNALQAPQVADRVRLLTGNTQISARELTHLIPLDP
ncbi:MAG: N-6 DNA methylase [Actinomycetota bacterium]|nr:N-6 DNA methylase [Actinomycetota bacterium]